MRLTRRGFTLIEAIVAMGLSLAVLATGYSMYANVLKAHDLESKRESVALTVQNVLGLIKRDVRGASSVGGGRASLIIDGGLVTYTSRPSGVQRSTPRGKCTYKDTTAEFSRDAGGVRVAVRSNIRVHRRPIRIEISSFVSPRNGT